MRYALRHSRAVFTTVGNPTLLSQSKERLYRSSLVRGISRLSVYDEHGVPFLHGKIGFRPMWTFSVLILTQLTVLGRSRGDSAL